jgi:hypothetical protein
MAQFILFYTNGPGEVPPPLPDDEMQRLIGEYVAWGEKLRAEGRMIGGARLTSVWSDPGRIVDGEGCDFLVTDGPLAETKEVVGGYSVIEARDYAAAASACKGHPHLRAGRIVIRQLA